MTPERWRQVESLYHSALALEESQRARFIEDSCSGDDDLRREVAALLRHEAQADGFLEIPALESLARELAQSPDAAAISESGQEGDPRQLIGRSVSHYRVVSKLGGGGMGVVYRAEDPRLGRHVALKFLPERTRDSASLERLRREARAASALSHPNICTVYDVGEFEGDYFIAMEALEGQTLRERLASPLPIPLALDWAAQIADALESAHAKGVIHRDIKPSNIFITNRDQAKILDFGLAKRAPDSGSSSIETTLSLREESLTSPGEAIGTVAYMSPEQARGEDLDTRTDIFSFGCVLYEMVTGRPAFPGRTSALVFDGILRSTPLPPSQFNSRLPPGLEHVIFKALEKDRELRCQSASELRADLKRMLRDSDSGRSSSGGRQASGLRTRPHSWRYASAGAVVVFAAVAAIFFANGSLDWFRGPVSAPKIRSLAVLPLENLSHDPEQEYFADGMTDQLITDLSKLASLRVISRTSVMRYKQTRKSIPEIASELGVDAVIEGSVLRSGNRIRISAKLIQAPNEKQLWAESYERDLRDAISLQGEVARSVSREFRLQLSPGEQTRLMAKQPVNPEVQEAYLRGRYFASRLNPGEFEKAIGYFNQAIKLDPSFAPAYADLAETYGWATALQVIPSRDGLLKAKTAALQAIELDSSIGEAHNALAWAKYVNDWDFAGSEREFKRALDLSPGEPNVHLWYGMFLVQGGRVAESLSEMDIARHLDPLSPMVGALSVQPLLSGGQYDEAIERLHGVLELEKGSGMALFFLHQAYEQKGDFATAIQKSAEISAMFGEPEMSVKKRTAALTQSYERGGARAYWQDQLKILQAAWQRNPGDAYRFAPIYARLGDRDQAFAWLDKAYQQHSQELTLSLLVDTAFEPMHSDPRFQNLLRRMGRAQ